MEKGDDGGVAYSLSKLFQLHEGLNIASPPLPFYELITEYLVHLGNQDFVHVITGSCEGPRRVQYFCITIFQIIVGEGGTHMIKTLHSTVRSVDIKGLDWFTLQFCFTQ
ncbi:uncharacterized protein Pyn_40475 [Prunus yedoensis var. nudiflora]|uniref:Uncharacterized protein n=1 Tax=Prunus yedoensis var. nudiflora TaxID=2094558 RepID=A0A314XWD8_PRUYE|nr:uncharacterized protein Pyn_40475 [Prunus yedoensis var. nudiflora]